MSGAIQAVGLDAGGTLIDLREPVGETYARHARSLGFAVDAPAMERGFERAFRAAPPLAAPRAASAPERLAFERAWWHDVVRGALEHALGAPVAARGPGSPFARLFDDLFAHYATAAAWRLWPDALPCLEALARRDLRIGILSNFDGRLHPLVGELGLRPFVSAVVVSSEAGAAKPAARAFAELRRALGGAAPRRCLHVGDSLEEDARGAAAASLHAAWLARRAPADEDGAGGAGIARIATLAEIPALLDALARAPHPALD